jgi:hypothetical protein
MQESPSYKSGGENYHPEPSSGGLLGTPSQMDFAENNGIFGGMNWGGSGMSAAANDHGLQQDAADNTAVGRISIPA